MNPYDAWRKREQLEKKVGPRTMAPRKALPNPHAAYGPGATRQGVPGGTDSLARQRPNSVGGSGYASGGGYDSSEHPSQYRDARTNIPPMYIEDVDIDYNWFTPMQPVWPFGPPNVNYPREWDYPVGYNLNYIPERFQLFQMLRAMSQSWGVLRTVIETRKDQLLRIPWEFQIIGMSAKDRQDPTKKKDPRIVKLEQFFRKPDGKHRFGQWARMLLDDLFTIDAATVYKWRTRGGDIYKLEVLDGATIKPLVDDAGRIPDAPWPAYQQIIKGLPMINLDETEIQYCPMRPRPQLPIFGYSPVEQVYLEVMEGIKRTLYQLNYWNEGTIPDLIITVPETWNAQQIAAFQGHFDALLEGNLNLKSKVRFVPSGMKPFEIKSMENLKIEYDEWITRIICYAFSVPPSPFIREMNRATAGTAKEAAAEEGLFPLMYWFKNDLMDPLVQEDFGFEDIEFTWMPEDDTDPKTRAEIIEGQVKVGLMTPNEGRDEMGRDPYADCGDEPLIFVGTGAVTLASAEGAAAPGSPEAAQQQVDTATQIQASKPQAPAGNKVQNQKVALGELKKKFPRDQSEQDTGVMPHRSNSWQTY